MARFSILSLEWNEKARGIEELARVFCAISSLEEFRDLLNDLFSHTEMIMFLRRIDTASGIIAGERYADIRRKLGVSTATIRSVRSRIERHGGGFLLATKLLAEIRREISDEFKESFTAYSDPDGFPALKKRYGKDGVSDVLTSIMKIAKRSTAAKNRSKSLKKPRTLKSNSR